MDDYDVGFFINMKSFFVLFGIIADFRARGNDHILVDDGHVNFAVGPHMHPVHENRIDDTKDQICVALETAHPAKFPDQIREILGIEPELPDSLAEVEKKQESFVEMGNDYDDFKEFLKRKYG